MGGIGDEHLAPFRRLGREKEVGKGFGKKTESVGMF